MKDNKTAKTNHRFSREGVKTETRSEVAGDFRIKLNLAHNHRGVEKLYESMHLNQGVFISERISAHSSVSSSFAFILAIEEVSNLNIPKRAEYIRIIASELERIRAHLYCLVLLGSETGSGMLRSEAERRLIEILSLFEKLFGNRYHSALMRIGGVNIDITFEDGYILRDFLDKILRTVDYLRRAVESDPLLGLRIKGMGVLTSDIIRQYGISGPAARASGLDIDIRKDEPYSLYSNLNFSVPVRSEGDIYARLLIRIEEIFESASIVGACLTMLKRVNSPLFTQLDKMPKGEGIGRTESPEGEFFHYIRTRGGNVPFRHKVRPPSYMISPVVEKIFKYCGIENYPLILISLDPAYSYFSGLIAEVGNFENPTEISESGFSDSTKKKSKYFVPGRK